LPDDVEEDLLLKVVDQAKVPDSGGKSLTTPAKGEMEGWVDLDYKQSGKNSVLLYQVL
jgi:hypothetical protein